MKQNKNRKSIYLTLILIAFAGLVSIGLSYSYYLANFKVNNEENKSSNISTASITEVEMNMQGKISIQNAYPGHKEVKEVIVRGIGKNNSIPANASIKITPNLGVFTGDVTWKLYKSDEKITCNSSLEIDNLAVYENGTCNIPSGAYLELEGSSRSVFKNIIVKPNTETRYYLVVEYLNRKDKDQSDQMNNTFDIDISLNDKVFTFADKIADLATNNTTNFATDDPDSNVRYIGADPNNYVYFNCSDYNNQSDSTCEKWRIIGVFNNVTKSDGTKENLVKIIRDECIGNYSWDSSASSVNDGYGVNDWTDADAMKLLNPGHASESAGGSLYYNAKSGTCYADSSNATTTCDFTSTGLKNDTTKNAIENVVWNVGGSLTYNDVTASMFYERERGTTVYSGRPTTWTGKIGLMYPSDYGYATAGGSTANRASCLAKELYNWDNSSYSDCKKNDYLYKSSCHQWTLAHSLSNARFVFYVRSFSNAIDGNAYNAFGVRPTLYLKSSISIASGNGTSSNPYQLNL